jgi:hypothetical protein
MSGSELRALCTELLYQALTAPIGIAVVTNDPERAVQRLYAARTAAGDPQLARLSLRRNPLRPEAEVFIIKTTVERTEAMP